MPAAAHCAPTCPRAAAAFNVHEVDKDWQAEVRSLLQACRVHVPCRWHVADADAPLRRFVLEGDLALAKPIKAPTMPVPHKPPPPPTDDDDDDDPFAPEPAPRSRKDASQANPLRGIRG